MTIKIGKENVGSDINWLSINFGTAFINQRFIGRWNLECVLSICLSIAVF